MSKKSFILMALVVNLTICLTLCIVIFTDKDNTENSDKQVSELLSSEIKEEDDNSPAGKETSSDYTVNTDTDSISEETSDNEDTTTKVVESQVSTETQPYIYNKTTDTTANSESSSIQETTTEALTEPVTVLNGTSAVINSSCNIRLSADVSGNVVGTANAGMSYRIEPAKCSSNWIAIYLDANTIGYISSSYCTVQ